MPKQPTLTSRQQHPLLIEDVCRQIRSSYRSRFQSEMHHLIYSLICSLVTGNDGGVLLLPKRRRQSTPFPPRMLSLEFSGRSCLQAIPPLESLAREQRRQGGQ